MDSKKWLKFICFLLITNIIVLVTLIILLLDIKEKTIDNKIIINRIRKNLLD